MNAKEKATGYGQKLMSNITVGICVSINAHRGFICLKMNKLSQIKHYTII